MQKRSPNQNDGKESIDNNRLPEEKAKDRKKWKNLQDQLGKALEKTNENIGQYIRLLDYLQQRKKCELEQPSAQKESQSVYQKRVTFNKERYGTYEKYKKLKALKEQVDQKLKMIENRLQNQIYYDQPKMDVKYQTYNEILNQCQDIQQFGENEILQELEQILSNETDEGVIENMIKENSGKEEVNVLQKLKTRLMHKKLEKIKQDYIDLQSEIKYIKKKYEQKAEEVESRVTTLLQACKGVYDYNQQNPINSSLINNSLELDEHQKERGMGEEEQAEMILQMQSRQQEIDDRILALVNSISELNKYHEEKELGQKEKYDKIQAKQDEISQYFQKLDQTKQEMSEKILEQQNEIASLTQKFQSQLQIQEEEKIKQNDLIEAKDQENFDLKQKNTELEDQLKNQQEQYELKLKELMEKLEQEEQKNTKLEREIENTLSSQSNNDNNEIDDKYSNLPLQTETQ